MWRLIISIEAIPQDRDFMLAVVDQNEPNLAEGNARNTPLHPSPHMAGRDRPS
jgi:hypothetical protein